MFASIGLLIFYIDSLIISNPLKKLLTRIQGWIYFYINGSVTPNISPAKITTLFVPSPTYSSCARLISIKLFAAGCTTSIYLSIAFPSFVRTMPPIGSKSILSIDFGPNVLLTISEIAFAALILASCAFLPDYLLAPWLRMIIGVPCGIIILLNIN